MIIQTWDKAVEIVFDKRPSEIQGLAYHKVFQRICTGESETDAVLEVIRRGIPKIIEKYQTHCFCGNVEADISICPVRDTARCVKGAHVQMAVYPNCSAAMELQRSERMISIGKAAATLAHGVRNPLNAIKGAIFYLGNKYADDEGIVQFTRMAEEEIARLDAFIARFLEAPLPGDEEGHARSDINALLRKLETLIAYQARVSNIDWSSGYDEVPALLIDSFQLEQAILNVLNNAIEAMPAGGHLTLKTRCERAEDEAFVVIEISDTGPGMAVKGRNGYVSAQTRQGRGFGLYLAQEVLQHHNGRLEIDCESGPGTTVRLMLPISEGGTEDAA